MNLFQNIIFYILKEEEVCKEFNSHYKYFKLYEEYKVIKILFRRLLHKELSNRFPKKVPAF